MQERSTDGVGHGPYNRSARVTRDTHSRTEVELDAVVLADLPVTLIARNDTGWRERSFATPIS